MRDEGKTQQEIAVEVGVRQSTIAEIIGNSKTGKIDNESETKSEPGLEPIMEEIAKELEAAEPDIPQADEPLVEEDVDLSEIDYQPEATDTSVAAEEPDTSDPEPLPPEPIPTEIMDTAHAVMGAFIEMRPDDYVARLEASPGEWMTITDDSLSNELERGLLTSAAAMCLWQEWMVWYQGERTNAFTEAFAKIGPVFVRGQAGQWSIASRLRSILRRLRI